jgi:hypothetical protein
MHPVSAGNETVHIGENMFQVATPLLFLTDPLNKAFVLNSPPEIDEEFL